MMSGGLREKASRFLIALQKVHFLLFFACFSVQLIIFAVKKEKLWTCN